MGTPAMPKTSANLNSERLSFQEYNAGDCRAAIRGERVPYGLGLALIRLCLIRGIRYHTDFAKELHGILPEFTRALNARMIMSNVIPDMDNAPEEEIPYCIWHPDVASESTYQRLVQRFPRMKYQVARACAVAGYTDLYLKLDVLPDVHVAEEARECGNAAIFDHIMAAPVRYTVMNDYTRSIDASNEKSADLNGDTAVRWMLDIKQEFTHADPYDEDDFGIFFSSGFDKNYFNITEDMNIDEVESPRTRPGYDITPLLSAPLAVHLPTVNKDLLILMAAYYGDIDRYVRLRRPMMIDKELNCCVHGIYHHTMFAIWWSKQPHPKHPVITEAVNARFIMNNVLSPITLPGDASLPTLIAHPTIACKSTYLALVKYKPSMLKQVLQACITADYTDLFEELIAKISKFDLEKLINSQLISNPHFREVVERRMKELNVTPGVGGHSVLKPSQDFSRSSINIPDQMHVDLVGTGFSSNWREEFMNGWQCDASEVELLACLPDEWKLPSDAHGRVELDYVDWPPNWEVLEPPL